MAKKTTTMYQGKEVETIDMTPTWRGLLPYYLLVLESGNAEGKKIAREELARMADIADAYVTLQKQNQEGK